MITRNDSRVSLSWMTNDLRSLKITKESLKRHSVRLNHEYKLLSRLRGVQRRLKSHPKSFWSYVSEKREEVGLITNGNTACAPQEICDLFAIKFFNVFEDEQISENSIDDASSNVLLTTQARGLVDDNLETISRAASQLKSARA